MAYTKEGVFSMRHKPSPKRHQLALLILSGLFAASPVLASSDDPTYHDPSKYNQLGREAQEKAESLLQDKPAEDVKEKKTKVNLQESQRFIEETLDKEELTPGQKNNQMLLDASNHLKSQRYKEAKSLLQELLNVDPSNCQVYLLLGQTQILMGDYQGAINTLDGAIAIDPSFLAAYLERAKAYLALEMNSKAKADFDYLLKEGGQQLPPALIKELKSASASLAPERKHQFTFILSTTGSHDSNVTAGTADSIANAKLAELGGPVAVGDSDPTQRSDRVFNGNAIISHNFPLAMEGFTWRNLMLFSEGMNARVKSSNLFLMLYTTTLAHKFQKHSIDYSLSLTRLVINKNLSQINQALGIKYSYQMAKNLALRAGTTLTHRRHYLPKDKDDSYSSNYGFLLSYDLGASYTYNQKHAWDLGFMISHDMKPGSVATPASYTRFLSYQTALNYNYKWTQYFTLKTGLIGKRDLYRTPDQVLTKIKRRDTSITAKAGWSYLIPLKDQIVKNITIEMNGSIKRNRSNSPLNQYTSKQISLGLSVIF
jgi:tetratricopeptide (TPR) repeat protein